MREARHVTIHRQARCWIWYPYWGYPAKCDISHPSKPVVKRHRSVVTPLSTENLKVLVPKYTVEVLRRAHHDAANRRAGAEIVLMFEAAICLPQLRTGAILEHC
jgi:hypothetical protein